MNFRFCSSKPELPFIMYNRKYIIFTNTISLVINIRIFLKFPGLDSFICKWERHFLKGFNIKIKEDQVCSTPQHIANMQWISFKLHLSFRTFISFWASTQSPFVLVEDVWACEKKQVLTVKKEVVEFEIWLKQTFFDKGFKNLISYT